MALGAVIEELLDPEAELRPGLLSRLSGLLPDEQGEFREAWGGIPAGRRLRIVEGVAGLAETNIELDFVPVLRAALEDDDAGVRAAAATGLWETDDRVVIRPLLCLLESDESPDARAAAASTLGHFVDLAEAGKLIERDAGKLRDALLAALENGDEEGLVRRRALEAIAPLATPRITQWVRWAYERGDSAFRQSAVYAMGRTCDAAWLPDVVDEMESDDPAMRFEAANAARGIADPEALPRLHELVGDHDAQVSIAAVQAIAAIGGPVARKLLRRYAATADAGVAEAAEEALAVSESEDMDFSMLDYPDEDDD